MKSDGRNVPLREIREMKRVISRPNRAASIVIHELLFVRDDELVEADLAFSWFAHAVEQLLHQTAETRLADGIVVMLAVASRLDQTGDAEQRQVMADGRLTLAEPIAQSCYVQFRLAGEIHKDPQARLVRKELEDLDQLLL